MKKMIRREEEPSHILFDYLTDDYEVKGRAIKGNKYYYFVSALDYMSNSELYKVAKAFCSWYESSNPEDTDCDVIILLNGKGLYVTWQLTDTLTYGLPTFDLYIDNKS